MRVFRCLAPRRWSRPRSRRRRRRPDTLAAAEVRPGAAATGQFHTRITATAQWVRTVRLASATGRKGSRRRPIRATRTLASSRRPSAHSPRLPGANPPAIGGSVTSATIGPGGGPIFAPEPSGDHVYGNDDEDDGGGATSWWVYRKVHDQASASELSRSRRFGTSVLWRMFAQGNDAARLERRTEGSLFAPLVTAPRRIWQEVAMRKLARMSILSLAAAALAAPAYAAAMGGGAGGGGGAFFPQGGGPPVGGAGAGPGPGGHVSGGDLAPRSQAAPNGGFLQQGKPGVWVSGRPVSGRPVGGDLAAPLSLARRPGLRPQRRIFLLRRRLLLRRDRRQQLLGLSQGLRPRRPFPRLGHIDLCEDQ